MSSPDATPPDDTPPTLWPSSLAPPLPSTEAGELTPGAPPGGFPNLAPTPPPGYELLGEVGRGGMGVVYRARQVSLGRLVAMKMMRSAEYAFEEDIRRFLVEAQAVARLQHPAIVQVFEFGRHGGLPYYTMEFVEGGSLHERALKRGLTPAEAARVVVQIARAIQHAHDNGILHRDLKPENVLLTADGQPRVTDFGLARISQEGPSDRTRTGTILGTPGYMAPEQAAGRSRQVGPHSDVYSLGAILYRLLVGRPPFLAETPHETLMRVISDEPVPPRNLKPAVPRDLETICLKCLQKEPSGRYHSAGELADDLERWLNHEPILAHRIGTAERLAKWVRRNRLVASLLAAVALALVGGTVTSAALAVKASRSAGRAADRANDAEEAKGLAEKAKGVAEEERRRAERQRDRAEAIIYGSQLTAAHREWFAGNPHLAWRHLGESRWDLRGLEYRLLHNLFTRDYIRLGEHTSRVSAIAVSPDGALLASGDEDRRVLLHDALTGRLLRTLAKHAERVEAVAFSPDGSAVASAGLDGLIKVVEAATGKELHALNGHRDGVTDLAYSADGRLLASVSRDRTVRLWDAAAGRPAHLLVPAVSGQDATLESVAFSPDGRLLAVGGTNRLLQIWDVSRRKCLHELPADDQVDCLAFSPDGSRLASGAGNELRVWDTRTWKHLQTLEGHTGRVRAVAYRPDGLRLVSAGDDRTVVLWDAGSGKLARRLRGHRGAVLGLAAAHDGRRVFSAGEDGGIHVWDARAEDASSAQVIHDDQPVTGIDFSTDGSLIASSGKDRMVVLRRADNGERVRALAGHTGEATCVAFSPDGKRLVSGGEDRTVRLWDAATGKTLFKRQDHGDRVTAVAFSPDGKRILSASWDQTVRVFDAATGEPVLTFKGHQRPVLGAAFSPAGGLAASCDEEGFVRVWSVTSGEELLRLAGHDDKVNAVDFSSDGRLLLSASDDSTLKIWDARTGREVTTLKGHTERVLTAAFFPDDANVVVSGGQDGTVRLWNVSAGVPALTMAMGERFGYVNWVAVDRRGRRIAAGGTSGLVRSWDTEAEPDVLPLFTPHRASIQRATAGEDGERILGEDEEGRVLIWSATTGRLLGRTRQQAFPEGQPRLTLPDDRTLVLAGSELAVVFGGLRGAAVRRRHERLAGLARRDERWHREQTEAARRGPAFALTWHLDQLAADRAALPLRARMLAEAHERERNEDCVLLALGRQAACDRGCAVDRRRLLPALRAVAERTGTPLSRRVLAGVQLRAGSAEAALETLLPAADGEIEALLRALAEVRLGRHEQARILLRQARAGKKPAQGFDRVERELLEAELGSILR